MAMPARGHTCTLTIWKNAYGKSNLHRRQIAGTALTAQPARFSGWRVAKTKMETLLHALMDSILKANDGSADLICPSRGDVPQALFSTANSTCSVVSRQIGRASC